MSGLYYPAMAWRAGAIVSAVVGSLVLSFASASSASTPSASPSSITVDCGLANGATSTVITGRPGDGFTIQNTSSTTGCDFAGFSSIVTVTNLDGSNVLAANTTASLTVVAAGTFTVTPKASSPTTATMTVVIGDPTPQPEYDITFDANGGTCSSNPLSISVASGDWYALPTQGTGAYQCHRTGYELIGWIRNDTLLFGGAAEQAPDVPHGQQAAAADHTYLHAVWRPLGMELTLDANVNAQHSCMVDRKTNLDPADRRVASLVPEEKLPDYQLPSSAPCTPPGHTLKGWSLNGTPGSEAFMTLPDSVDGLFTLTLYAQWSGPDCSAPAAPGVNWYGCSLYLRDFSGANLAGADLRGGQFYGSNFTNANLTGADLRGGQFYGSNFTNAKLDSVNASGSVMYGSDFRGADLSGGNFANASLYVSCMLTTNFGGANLSGADLHLAVVPEGAPTWRGAAKGRPIVGIPRRNSFFFTDYGDYERTCVNRIGLPPGR